MIFSILRDMFFWFDKIIYGLIPQVYGLLLQLSRTSVFNQDVIHSFAIRIYALIGIFMFFKVSISLLTYLINPDEFASKEKGFGIIIRNVILALVILVIAPYGFNEAFEVQSMILEENTIMNLIFGTPSGDNSSSTISSDNYVNDAGGKIQFTILYTFAQPNYEEFAHDKAVADLNSCRNTYAKDAQGNFIFRKKAVIKTDKTTTNADSKSNFIYELDQDCFGIYDSETDTYDMNGTSKGQLWKAFNEVGADVAYQNYAQGVAQQSVSLFFTKDVIKAKTSDDRFLINYKLGISTAVGIFVLYFLLMFCIDVALRSVKLGFLEMIAPIPIISYCDPKSGKDGMFKKWFDMLWKTYLELFLRLFALYFGIYVISIIGTFRDVVTGDIVDGFLVNVFMIIGILIFIKKLPDILKEVFNIKSDGKFEFNPFKRIENEAFGGKQILGASAAIPAAIAGAGTNLIAKKGNVFSALAGGVSAGSRAIIGGLRGEKFGKNFSTSYSGAMKARQDRDSRNEVGVNAFDIAGQRLRQTMGITTKDQKMDAQVKRYNEATSSLDAAKSRAEGEVDKRADAIRTRSSGTQTLGALRDAHELWKNMNVHEYATSHGISEDAAVSEISQHAAEANTAYYKARKEATTEYVQRSMSGTLNDNTAFGNTSGSAIFSTSSDVTVQSNVKKAESAVATYGLEDVNGNKVSVNYSDIGGSSQTLKDASTRIQSDDKFRQAHVVAEQTQKQGK